jgi:hypothetical protein
MPGFYQPVHAAISGQRVSQEDYEWEPELSFYELWQKALDFALGELDLMPRDFWEMRPVDFKSKAAGFYRRQDYQSRQTREIIAVIMNANRDPQKQPQPFTGEQIWPLSIDRKKKVEKENKLTKEEIEWMSAAHLRAVEKVQKKREEKLQKQLSRLHKKGDT